MRRGQTCLGNSPANEASELDRLHSLGVHRSAIIGPGSWMVLEDPEANEFCLMPARISPEPAPFHEPERFVARLLRCRGAKRIDLHHCGR